MPYATLTGQAEPVGEKVNRLTETIDHYNEDGDKEGTGTVHFHHEPFNCVVIEGREGLTDDDISAHFRNHHIIF